MPSTTAPLEAGGGRRTKRKTETAGGQVIKTYYLCDSVGSPLKRYEKNEARNAPPSAAARKLAKHVVGKKKGAHTIHVRARGTHGKYSDGRPKVFGYTVRRVMVDVSPWKIEQSVAHGYINPATGREYEEGDKMPAYDVKAKKRKVSKKKSAKGTKRKAATSGKKKSAKKKSGKKKSGKKKSAKKKSKRLRGGGGFEAKAMLVDESETQDAATLILDASMNPTKAEDKSRCDACHALLKGDSADSKTVQTYVLRLAIAIGKTVEPSGNDDKKFKIVGVAETAEEMAALIAAKMPVTIKDVSKDKTHVVGEDAKELVPLSKFLKGELEGDETILA